MWAFHVCENLGIDDPVYWMDAVDPKVVDRWIAYYAVKNEISKGKGEPMTPEQARDKLNG